MVKKIFFKNYCAFPSEQELELRPVTLLVGKNSSGKSSVCRLIEMLADTLNCSEFPQGKSSDAIIDAGSGIYTAGDFTQLMVGAENEDGSVLKAYYSNMKGTSFLVHCDLKNAQFSRSYEFLPRFNTESVDVKLSQRLKEKNIIGLESFSFSVNHIGPIRKIKSSMLPNGSYPLEGVGYEGENACLMLVNSYVEGTDVYRLTADWFDNNLEGQGLMITSIPMSLQSQYQICIQRNGIAIDRVGEGMKQVLPVITETFNHKHADVTIIEQPALHLHPAAHASVINCIALSAKRNNRKYVVETHSGNALLELRRMVSDSECSLTPSDVVAYYVDMVDGEARLHKIEFLANGELSYWPTGVFGESFDLLAQIMKQQHV